MTEHPPTPQGDGAVLTVTGDNGRTLTWTPNADGLSGTWSGDAQWIMHATLSELHRNPVLVLHPGVYVELGAAEQTTRVDAAAIMIAVTGNRCDTTHLLDVLNAAGVLPAGDTVVGVVY